MGWWMLRLFLADASAHDYYDICACSRCLQRGFLPIRDAMLEHSRENIELSGPYGFFTVFRYQISTHPDKMNRYLGPCLR